MPGPIGSIHLLGLVGPVHLVPWPYGVRSWTVGPCWDRAHRAHAFVLGPVEAGHIGSIHLLGRVGPI